MASMTVPPSRTRRWTRVEYERLIELGVFQPGERLELLDGLLGGPRAAGEPARGDHPSCAGRVARCAWRPLADRLAASGRARRRLGARARHRRGSAGPG